MCHTVYHSLYISPSITLLDDGPFKIYIKKNLLFSDQVKIPEKKKAVACEGDLKKKRDKDYQTMLSKI